VINLMGGLGAIAAFLVGGALYKLGRISPFVFGSLVMLGAVSLVVLLVREPEARPEAPPAEEVKQANGSFLANLRDVFQASDRSGLLILLAILCWFLGYNAVETWISSLQVQPGDRRGAHGDLTSGRR
jgi:hypothetical protein